MEGKGLKVNGLGCGSQKERRKEVQFERETIYMTGGEWEKCFLDIILKSF